MLTETQHNVIQWFLILVIVVCVARITWLVVAHISAKRTYNKYAEDFFKKIEEYRNDIH